MKILKGRKLYLTALFIVAAVLSMLIFIGISTFRNLDNSRQSAIRLFHRQGIAILDTLAAGIGAEWLPETEREDVIYRMITEILKNKDIVHIYLIDGKGKITHRFGVFRNMKNPDWTLASGQETVGRFSTLQDGTSIYEVAKRFPVRISTKVAPENSRPQSDVSWMVIGMKLTAFEDAARADFFHAIVMVCILASLGIGAVFFIFVIRSYYLVNTTLKQTRDYMQQVIGCMAHGLLSIDASGIIVSHNQPALDMLGIEERTLFENQLSRIIDITPGDVNKILASCGSMIDREIVHRRPDGSLIPLSLSLTPITDGKDSCSGAVLTIRDLREIKRLEEKIRTSEKLAAIGKLAASVAHEIRNPLSSIRGFARFLSHVLKDRPDDQAYALIMVKEVDRINRVVSDLISFARPLPIESELTDIETLIDHVLCLIEGDSRSTQIRIEKSISRGLQPVAVDPNQITQVLLNLVLNSLQELGSGETIRIGAAEDVDNNTLEIWVEDEGQGIDHQQQQKIFDPFFTTKDKGTGLGLAIVRKIVESHHGVVLVKSPVYEGEKGTRVTIRIPINDQSMDTGK